VAERGQHRILRVDLSPGSGETRRFPSRVLFASSCKSIRSITVNEDTGALYWTAVKVGESGSDPNAVYTAYYDGVANPQLVLSQIPRIRGIAYDPSTQRLYFAEASTSSLFSVVPNSNPLATLIHHANGMSEGISSPEGVAIDSVRGVIYVAAATSGGTKAAVIAVRNTSDVSVASTVAVRDVILDATGISSATAVAIDP